MEAKHLKNSNTHNKKKLSKLRIDGNFLNLIRKLKKQNKKPSTKITLDENLNIFLLI